MDCSPFLTSRTGSFVKKLILISSGIFVGEDGGKLPLTTGGGKLPHSTPLYSRPYNPRPYSIMKTRWSRLSEEARTQCHR